MVTQTSAFVVPEDWYEVMEAKHTRSAEFLIAHVFSDANKHHTCVGAVSSEDGVIWRCEWCGALFTQPYHGAHARNTPRYLSDLSAALALVDDLRRRDKSLEVEIDLCSKASCPKGVPQTRIHVERAVSPYHAAELNRFVADAEYAKPNRSPLCVALWEAIFELYEYTIESETR